MRTWTDDPVPGWAELVKLPTGALVIDEDGDAYQVSRPFPDEVWFEIAGGEVSLQLRESDGRAPTAFGHSTWNLIGSLREVWRP